jgi:hypothetical protein
VHQPPVVDFQGFSFRAGRGNGEPEPKGQSVIPTGEEEAVLRALKAAAGGTHGG